MSCGACVRRVDRALRQNAAVREVSVHLEAAEATVEHDGSLTADALAAIVTGAGYPATPVPASGTSS